MTKKKKKKGKKERKKERIKSSRFNIYYYMYIMFGAVKYIK